ncbi:hypothetical protein E4U53_005065, partial [Claviceps sorghi]
MSARVPLQSAMPSAVPGMPPCNALQPTPPAHSGFRNAQRPSVLPRASGPPDVMMRTPIAASPATSLVL